MDRRPTARKRPRAERELLELEERRALEGIASAAKRMSGNLSRAADWDALVREHPLAVSCACAVAGWLAARHGPRLVARWGPWIARILRPGTISPLMSRRSVRTP